MRPPVPGAWSWYGINPVYQLVGTSTGGSLFLGILGLQVVKIGILWIRVWLRPWQVLFGRQYQVQHLVVDCRQTTKYWSGLPSVLCSPGCCLYDLVVFGPVIWCCFGFWISYSSANIFKFLFVNNLKMQVNHIESHLSLELRSWGFLLQLLRSLLEISSRIYGY